jgi:sialic acid synthase
MFSKGISGPYIIAEVGQNHQGDLDTAREFIKIFSQLGANAIKFQNRDNKYLFSDDAYNKPYDSPTSFAPTYGEHREKLELDKEAFLILKEDCRKYNVDFMSTPFDEPSLNHLIDIDVDVIKISSFDLGNLSFINRIAKTKKPLVMSIGGGNIEQIKSSISTISNHHKNLAILHCVSEYPCEYDRLGLSNIETLTKKYPDFTIGSSDHFNGTISGPIAFMMGAKVFEKHVTLNRASKGTDHSFALEPEGFRKFVRDIKRIPKMLPIKDSETLGEEYVFQKLGKSLVPIKDLKNGEILNLENLSGKIFKETFIPVRETNEILGKKISRDIKKGEPIKKSDLT